MKTKAELVKHIKEINLFSDKQLSILDDYNCDYGGSKHTGISLNDDCEISKINVDKLIKSIYNYLNNPHEEEYQDGYLLIIVEKLRDLKGYTLLV